MKRREAAFAAARWATVSAMLGPLAFAAPAAAKGDRALGEYLAGECVTCHQASGRFNGIPPIVGWPEASFIAIVDEYRRKTRPNAAMQTIAARLSDEEVAALAAYFGSLAPGGK